MSEKKEPTDYEKALFQRFCLEMYGETYELKQMIVDERTGHRIPVFDLINPILGEKETAIQLQCARFNHGPICYPKIVVSSQREFVEAIKLEAPYIKKPEFKQGSVICAEMFCHENEHYELKKAYNGQYKIFLNGQFLCDLVGRYFHVEATGFIPSLDIVILNVDLDLDYGGHQCKNYIFDLKSGALLVETGIDVAFYDIEKKKR